MFSYCCNFDSGNARVIRQVKMPSYFGHRSFPPDSIFFEFECRNDNEGTPHETPSKGYFNFLLRRCPDEDMLSFKKFFAITANVQPEFNNFVFVWKNPQKLVRLTSNQHRLAFRTFQQGTAVQDADLQQIPQSLHDSLRQIPDPTESKFNQTSIVELCGDYAFFQFQATISSEIIQVAHAHPFSLGQVFLNTQLKRPNQQYDIAISPIYKLPLRVYEFGTGPDVIILSARVHPGEALQSYVLSGILDALKSAEALLKQVTFVIIPALNPDGIHRGNYRSDCLGQNLNRTYNLQGDSYRLNEAVCNLVQKFLEEKRRIRMMVDLHNHATLQSLVCFGNDLVDEELYKTNVTKNGLMMYLQQKKKRPALSAGHIKATSAPQQTQQNEKYDPIVKGLRTVLKLQQENLKFPYFLQKSELFSAFKSDFSFESMGKEDQRGEPIEGTMRVQMFKQFQLGNVYTLEFNYSVNHGRSVRTVNYLFFKQVAEAVYQAILDCVASKDAFGMKSFCLVTGLQKELWE